MLKDHQLIIWLPFVVYMVNEMVIRNGRLSETFRYSKKDLRKTTCLNIIVVLKIVSFVFFDLINLYIHICKVGF